ncbi:hypothetical protein niasHT_019848 [Heterodera trifolii]|uniref:G-protein coupled receptors family 1 profile domain-containing protein n=1 Tax=Heterodera trifolii TaxID=157864 RepID=A0ABD2KVT6_9BILA
MKKLFLEERYDFGQGFIDGGGAGDANRTMDLQQKSVNVDDLFVFFALESLGTLAIVGNCCLVVVLMRNRYLQRASFVLMLSLALADILHGIVTTTFFYPPILLRRVVIPSIGVRIFNVIDWTAWSITLTHMSAICLDRLLAITLYGQYSQLITVRRAKLFTTFCWAAFSTLNTVYILARFCCLISPLAESHFYTFGYGEFESQSDRVKSPLRGANLFKLTYTPLELCTLAVLSISNPITFIQLYRRHKRKMALKMASTMLLEMSMRMGSKHVSTEVNEVATRRANRQQQRILFQISVVAIIFYLYMSAYYLLYHVFNVSNKWLVLFNSFFYSTTHMINPVIYFSLNKDMRAQLIRAIADCLNWACCVGDAAGLGRFGGIHSSIYGRASRRTQPGAESSSGGSVLLHKSSYGAGCMTEANSSVHTENAKPGWTLRTYRPPPPSSSAMAKRSFGALLSPTFCDVPSERTAMLASSATAAATAVPHSLSQQSPFVVVVNSRSGDHHRQQFVELADQPDDNNNVNRPKLLASSLSSLAEDGIGQQQKLTNLARSLADAVGNVAATVAERLEYIDEHEPSSTVVDEHHQSLAYIANNNNNNENIATVNQRWDSFGGLCPTRESFPGQPDNNHLPLMMRDMSSGKMDDDDNDDDDDADDEQSSMGAAAEQLELQLVDSWSMENDDENTEFAVAEGAVPLRHKDTLERLDGGKGERRLGMFLAERLAHGLERNERAMARASRQRNSLLDALISALILSEEGDDGSKKEQHQQDDGEQCQDELQLNNKLRRVCRDQQHNAKKKKNGLMTQTPTANYVNSNNNNNYANEHSDQQHHQQQQNWCSSTKNVSKKSRSMDLLQQQQQHKQQQRHEAVPATQPNSRNSCWAHQQQQQQNTGRSVSHATTSNSLQPMSGATSSSSSVNSWRRRRRSCEPRRGYVPLRECQRGDKSAEDEGEEEEDEEDVIFL